MGCSDGTLIGDAVWHADLTGPDRQRTCAFVEFLQDWLMVATLVPTMLTLLVESGRQFRTEHPLIQHVQMRTVCQHITLHSLITFHHADTRGSSLMICVPRHSVTHSSCFVLTAHHQHKFSLTYVSNLTVILPRSFYTLRRFTAELRFLGSPISHRL